MRNFFATTLLMFALAFAGCEPAGNNSGNAGNNGNGGTPTEPGTTNPTDPTHPTEPGTDGNGATSGNWDLEKWTAWSRSFTPSGTTSLSAFIDWVNTYFPDGIPKNPNSGSGNWDSTEWFAYMDSNTQARDAFPKSGETFIGSFNSFLAWARNEFSREDMPNTPPEGEWEIVDGPWKLADWQRWVDAGNEIDGVLYDIIPAFSHRGPGLTVFINWANTNFPDGIPVNPPGNAGNDPWDASAWSAWLNVGSEHAFPGDWSAFRGWAAGEFPDGMPNTPPSVAGSTAPATQSPALEEPSTGDVVGGLLDELTSSEAATADRSFEDAGMTEIQP